MNLGHRFADHLCLSVGISSREVARRYRASKALQQMEDDEEFGEYAHPKLYALFHEAVAQPKVREWLEFSDQDFTAHNENARRAFYELLSPRKIDEEKCARIYKPELLQAIRALSFEDFEKFGSRVLREIGATMVRVRQRQ